VRTSPSPIMAGGHAPATAALFATAFAARVDPGAKSDFRLPGGGGGSHEKSKNNPLQGSCAIP
jgi:hypothetical protein